MGQIRSRLVAFTVTAKRDKSDTWEQWEIPLQGNRLPEEKRGWLAMAHKGGYRDIKLEKKTTAQATRERRIQTQAEIATQGLALLDEILAKRKG